MTSRESRSTGNSGLVLVAFAIAATGATARAHGGEDHGAPAETAPVGAAGHSASAETEQTIVVLEHEAVALDHAAALRIYVADYATGAPIAGARVRLEVSAPRPITVDMRAARTMGLYEGRTTFGAAGPFDATVTIERGDDVDLVPLPGVRAGPIAPVVAGRSAAPRSQGLPGWAVAAGVVVAVLIVCAAAVAAVVWLVRSRRRRVAATAIVTSAMLALAADASAHGGEDHGEPASAPAAAGDALRVPILTQFLLGMRTEVTVPRPHRAALHVPGRVVPHRHVSVVPPLPGILLPPPSGTFPVVGQRVTQGQVLAVLSPTLAAPELASMRVGRSDAQTRTSAAQAQLALAERNLARLRSIGGVVAGRDLAAAETELTVARAALEGARRDLRAYGRRSISLRAPIDGTLTIAPRVAGQQVDGASPVFDVLDARTVWIEARIPETSLPLAEAVDRANVRSALYPDLALLARRIALGQEVEARDRAVPATFEVDNPDSRLRIGMLVDVGLERGDATPAIVIPEEALVDAAGGDAVIVRMGPERFALRPVQIGERDGARVVVLQGLEPATRVVVRAATTLAAGAR